MKKNVMKTLVFALLVSTGFTLGSCDDEKEVNPDVEIVNTELGAYVSGIVTDGSAPLSGVTISAGSQSATTDANGAYTLPASAGNVSVSASLDGYISATRSVEVGKTSVATLDFELTPRNDSQTLTPDNELQIEEQIDKITSMTFPAGSVSENTEVSITEYRAMTQPDNVGALSVVSVSASLDGYISATRSVEVGKTSVATLDFELTPRNDSQTLTPDNELQIEEQIDKITSMTFPAGSVSENTEVSITEYRAMTQPDNVGALSVVYCEPDGQEFAQPVRVEIAKNTSDEVAFADMKHYVQNADGKWVEEGDVTLEGDHYVTELTHFSNHAFGAAALWSAASGQDGESTTIEIDNLGSLTATSQNISVSAHSGWEVDGDLASIVSAALSGIGQSDAAALATDLHRMIRNAKGTSANASSRTVSLGTVEVSGDTRATITVTQRVVSRTMSVNVIFRGSTVTVAVPVIEYGGADMSVSYEYGDLRPEHSGGEIG